MVQEVHPVPMVQVPPVPAAYIVHYTPPPHAPYPPAPLPANFFRDNKNAMICDERKHLKQLIHATQPNVVAVLPAPDDKTKKLRTLSLIMTTRAASRCGKIVEKIRAAKAIQRLWRVHVQKQIALNDIDAVDFYEDKSFNM
jgi:hypothetical protein